MLEATGPHSKELPPQPKAREIRPPITVRLVMMMGSNRRQPALEAGIGEIPDMHQQGGHVVAGRRGDHADRPPPAAPLSPGEWRCHRFTSCGAGARLDHRHPVEFHFRVLGTGHGEIGPRTEQYHDNEDRICKAMGTQNGRHPWVWIYWEP